MCKAWHQYNERPRALALLNLPLVRVFWYQVYQARLWERMLNRSASLAMSTSVLKALPGKLDIKRHSPSILYIWASLAMSTSVLKALPGKLDIKRHSPSILYFLTMLEWRIQLTLILLPSKPTNPFSLEWFNDVHWSMIFPREV